MGSISIKTAEDIEGMRIAGKLAAEVLDFIAPYVRAGIFLLYTSPSPPD